jgi:hypothetical protein
MNENENENEETFDSMLMTNLMIKCTFIEFIRKFVLLKYAEK